MYSHLYKCTTEVSCFNIYTESRDVQVVCCVQLSSYSYVQYSVAFVCTNHIYNFSKKTK